LLKMMRVAYLAVYNVDEIGLFCWLPFNKALNVTGDPCNGRRKYKDSITILLACSANWPDKHPPLLTGKIGKPH